MIEWRWLNPYYWRYRLRTRNPIYMRELSELWLERNRISKECHKR